MFGPLKAAYRDQVERFCRGGVNTIGKQHFTYLYSSAREKTLTKKIILAGWRGKLDISILTESSQICRSPHIELTDVKADNVREESCPQYEPLRTPLTPKSPEALTLLLNMIKKVSDDETSRQYKWRLQQKVNNAAQIFLAKNALLEDRNRF